MRSTVNQGPPLDWHHIAFSDVNSSSMSSRNRYVLRRGMFEYQYDKVPYTQSHHESEQWYVIGTL